ncbi:hypothetical protein ACOMHN_063991 [Nucella lapillus]
MADTAVRAKNRRKDTGCCSLPYLRSVMVIFNVILWLTGLTFLGLGVWALVSKHHYISLLGSHTYSATTFLFLSIGCLVILAGMLGCLGALRQMRCCLVLFACLLLLIFVMEAISGVLAYMYESAIREELARNLNRTMMEGYGLTPGVSHAVDSMQRDFECCGTSGERSYLDWEFSQWLQTTDTALRVPDSCCISPSQGCGASTHPSNIYWGGCWSKLELFLKSHLILIGGVGLGFCCLQIFGIIFACCMARKIKEVRGFI